MVRETYPQGQTPSPQANPHGVGNGLPQPFRAACSVGSTPARGLARRATAPPPGGPPGYSVFFPGAEHTNAVPPQTQPAQGEGPLGNRHAHLTIGPIGPPNIPGAPFPNPNPATEVTQNLGLSLGRAARLIRIFDAQYELPTMSVGKAAVKSAM
ncbi:MAG: hypothetical protein CM15mP74_05500 [Halieaceae bacterium]|nr:MAG: hypothetical protein CM15mP74_05500 [Halieaceae bacterium]